MVCMYVDEYGITSIQNHACSCTKQFEDRSEILYLEYQKPTAMIKIALMVTCWFILSCGSNQTASNENKDPSPENNNSSTENKSKMSDKYGNWELDADGNKFREDYELRDMLRGNELVKYSRIDGGQFGGGSSETKFTLCSDGSLRYYHQSLTTVSVDGAGGSDAKQEEDEGSWKALETEAGLKLIMLKSTKYNTTGYMEVKPMGSKIQLVWFNEWQEFFVKKTDC